MYVEIKIVNKEAATKRSTLLHAQRTSFSRSALVHSRDHLFLLRNKEHDVSFLPTRVSGCQHPLTPCRFFLCLFALQLSSSHVFFNNFHTSFLLHSFHWLFSVSLTAIAEDFSLLIPFNVPKPSQSLTSQKFL